MRFCISAFKPPAALVEGDVIDLVNKQYLLIPRYVLGIPSALYGIDKPGGQTHALKVTLPHPHPHPAAIEPRDSTGLRRQKVTSATPFQDSQVEGDVEGREPHDSLWSRCQSQQTKDGPVVQFGGRDFSEFLMLVIQLICCGC